MRQRLHFLSGKGAMGWGGDPSSPLSLIRWGKEIMYHWEVGWGKGKGKGAI